MSDSAVETLSNQQLLEAWKSGHDAAASVLFRRFHVRLTALVQSRLSRRLALRVDAEDIVLSAWRSVFVGFDRGLMSVPEDDHLWPLLATVTMRKLARQASRNTTQYQDVRRDATELPEAFLPDFAAADPTPSALATASELLKNALDRLSAVDREIVGLRLQGEQHSEIAKTTGRSERTVRRVLKAFREILEGGRQPDRIDAIAETGPRPASAGHAGVRAAGPPTTALADIDYVDLKLHRLIGQGSFGKVYLATWLRNGQRVAVKFLKKRFWRDRRCVESLIREVSQTQLLNQPSVVRVHGFGVTPHGGTFIVTDYVEGKNLNQWRASQGLTSQQITACGILIARALQAIHESGVVHGDISPGNVLIRDDQTPLITDFGFARLIGEAADVPVGGTPGFLAPEQISSAFGPIGVHTDIYGFGGLLYFLATGQSPNQADSLVGTLSGILSDSPGPAPIRTLPKCLNKVVMQCLRKPIALRPASFSEILDSIESPSIGFNGTD